MRRLSRSNATIADIFSTHVAKTPEKACLVFEGKTWTFREVSVEIFGLILLFLLKAIP
jgi:acyl-CoA synthetase (AMP-forming)/AMP-acid ligase II